MTRCFMDQVVLFAKSHFTFGISEVIIATKILAFSNQIKF